MPNPIAPVKSGRRLTIDRVRFTRFADDAELGIVSRSQLIVLAKQLPVIRIISNTEARLLDVLLNTAPVESFATNGIPIVFKSNSEIAFQLGLSAGRVSRLLSRLYDAGLIVMRDSGNFKRYPIRDSDGNIMTACGIDLRVFIARYVELKNKVADVVTEHRRHKAAVRRYRGLLRQVNACIATFEITPLSLIMKSRCEHVAKVVGMPAKADSRLLEKAIRLFSKMLERLFGFKTQNMTYPYAENNKHKLNTNPENVYICNRTARRNANEPNSPEKNDAPPPLNASTLPYIQQGILSKALSNVALFLKNPIRGTHDLTYSVDFLAKMFRISPDALDQARQAMGPEKTALAISITLEKHCRGLVKSPGGYIRAMTQRERNGQLHLMRSLQSLMKTAK